MEISYISRINSNEVLSKNIKTFDIPQLTTSETIKSESPAWNFTTMKARSNPTKISGFVIDYDSHKKPSLNDKYTYFSHQTHNKKWRIIVPFAKSHPFSNASDYKSEHCKMMALLFDEGLSVEQLLTDPKDLKKAFVDPKSLTPTQFYFLRPKGFKLLENKGEFYKPSFLKFTKSAGFVPQFATPVVITDEAKCRATLARIMEFYDYYKSSINFKFIRQKNDRCVVCQDLDDKPNDGELQLNSGGGDFVANIYCHHKNCKSRLDDKMQPFMPIDSKTEQVIYVRNYTILYLAYGVMMGKFSLQAVEACGYHRYLSMLIDQNYLLHLTFNSKKDMPIWLKILHEGIVYRELDKTIFNYEDGAYKAVHRDSLTAYYHDSAGTYAAYRWKSLNPKEYVLRLVEYGFGKMQDDYKRLVIPDGINLKNGGFMWTGKGGYEFNPPTPNIFFTHQLGFNYDPDAKCPLWEKTLADYFGSAKESQAIILQEFFGYCLTYDRRFEKLLILYGVTGGGKNTIMGVLSELIPTETSTMQLLCSPKDCEFIVDKKLIIVNESVGKFGNHTMNMLKKISSSDPVAVRPLFKPAYGLTNVPKIAVLFNDAPETMRIDDALKARMLTIKLTKSFRNKAQTNIHLVDELKKELSGIFNWALEGYLRLYKQQKFTMFARDTNELYEDANEYKMDFIAFLHKMREREYLWTSSDLYHHYIEAFEGSEVWSQNLFSRKAKQVGAMKKRKADSNYFNLEKIRPMEGVE